MKNLVSVGISMMFLFYLSASNDLAKFASYILCVLGTLAPAHAKHGITKQS